MTITKNGKPVAVLTAVDDLESLGETLEALSDPEAMAAIAEDQSGTGGLTRDFAPQRRLRVGHGATGAGFTKACQGTSRMRHFEYMR